MKINYSKYIFIALLMMFQLASAQDKTVTLVSSGQGKTQDEAKQSALRNAIEQAFGTFVSSKTEILNDNLIKDEIVSVSNGNIQKYEVLSEVKLPDGSCATTLKATVSITKLTTFAENKGFNVEFKGSLFAFNINQQKLNEKNELKALEGLFEILKPLSDISFTHSLKAKEPIASSNDKWKISLEIDISLNKNLTKVVDVIFNTLSGISMTREEANNYLKLNKRVYPVSMAISAKKYDYFIFRNEESISAILTQLYYFNHSILNFKISNGLETWKLSDKPSQIKYIYDKEFRPILELGNPSGLLMSIFKRSLFYGNGPGCSYGVDAYINIDDRRHLTTTASCYFNPFYDYTEWKNKVHSQFMLTWDPGKLNKGRNEVIDNEYDFLEDIKDPIKNSRLMSWPVFGLVISFININEGKSVVRFYYEDERNLQEINKITEYKIIQSE